MNAPTGPGAALQQAVAALQSGRFQEAESVLRPVVAAAPTLGEAQHLLGVALSRQGRLEEGLACLDRAVALLPQSAACLHNRAQSRLSTGRVQEARADLEKAIQIAPQFDLAWTALGALLGAAGDAAGAERHYRRALTLRPANPDTLYNLALLLQGLGRADEAIACYRKALQLRPTFAAAHNNLANVLQQAGRIAEAAVHYQEAIRHDPGLADAYANYGSALRLAGRIDDAVALLERADRLRPGNPEILNNLGVTYFARNRFADAERCYRRALETRPDFVEALNNLGNALASQGRNDEAIAIYRDLIARAPSYADAHSNLGLQLQERGALEAAMACYAEALALDPAHADAINNQGYLLQELGRVDEAMGLYRRALEANPRSARAAYNLGLAHLTRFEFAEGWRGCELRYFTTPPVAVMRPFDVPAFTEADWGKGHRLAIWREQGLGDQLLYATLLPELEARGQDFMLEVDRRLVPAFQRAHPGWNVVAPEDSSAAFRGAQRHLPSASLPRLLRPSRESFARQPEALLQPDAVRREAFRARLAEPGTRTIGISWRSFQPSARGFLQRKKSAPLAAFAALSRRQNLRLLDLQYGDTSEERAAFAAEGGRLARFEELDLFNDIEGVLAAVAACDLVITTSNVTAHFAGVLGVPAWVLYPRAVAPFHYWVPDESGRCLWYPSVRIVTGADLRDWDEVFRLVDERLDA